MKPLAVTILYDGEEDRWYEEAKATAGAAAVGSEAPPLPDAPVHVPLGEVLAARGYRVRKLAAEADIARLVRSLKADRSDVIFNICDGIEGDTHRAIRVAALLELLGRTFTGSGAEAMAIAQDKVLSKQLFAYYGVPTPKFALLDRGCLEWAENQLGFPLIVKPSNEDASVGISDEAVVHEVEALIARVGYVHNELKRPALVEEYIDGREIYVPILGNDPPRVLPLLEWKFAGNGGRPKIGTYEAKWVPKHEDYQPVAVCFLENIDPEIRARIEDAALKAYRALRLSDYARVDVRLAPDGTFYFLEINANPFLDPKAELAMAAARVGMEYPQLAEHILELALSRHGKQTSRAPRKGWLSRVPEPKVTAGVDAAAAKAGVQAVPAPSPASAPPSAR